MIVSQRLKEDLHLDRSLKTLLNVLYFLIFMDDYTKNEIALLNFISSVNKQFYYIGEENDQVSKSDLKKFSDYCNTFINSLEVEN